MTVASPEFEPANVGPAATSEASGASQTLAVPDSPLSAALAPTPQGFLSGLQTVIGLTAGLLSILGALLAVPGLLGGNTGKGDVVTIVREARTERALPGAVVQILTSNDAVVTTLRANSLGRTRYALNEGPYRIRVSHPQYASEVRDVQVLTNQAAEIPVRLRVAAVR
jgi:hypothetical protein